MRIAENLRRVHLNASILFVTSGIPSRPPTPRQFGFIWLRPPNNQSSPSSVSNVTQRTQLALASAALEQCSLLFPQDLAWQSTIGRLRFAHMTQLFLRTIATQKTPTKVSYKKNAGVRISFI
ncbi:unnamed protein product [Dibothriocephalus latus]|uniref:Uncharacterized protein n=1 Tax=Dibothriocephalus latus TaxID=60516 RepID=A0A3P7PC35_DIBLA|nr:unnamed protein product [Dibothriocephalus latus]